MSTELLIAAGEALYGERWQTPLARDLGLPDGRRVRQWLAGERPIPASVWDTLPVLLESRNVSIHKLISEIQNDK
jgi:hypothetical protein